MISLVFGANGQDGSYICELLSKRGAKVAAIGRSAKPKYFARDQIDQYLQGDLRDYRWLAQTIGEVKPDEIYHLAAVHGPAGFSYEPVWNDAVDVNVKALYCALEYARTINPQCRVFYPSSAKVFGAPLPPQLDINTPRVVSCLYSNNKLSAEKLLHHYRETHGIRAAIAYLFNHESSRRSADYFIPKVVAALSAAVMGKTETHNLYSLDFYCDWGSAEEYMGLAIDLLRLDQSEDVIFASGKTHHARTFVRDLFAKFDHDYQQFIVETNKDLGGQSYAVEISHTRSVLGRAPTQDIMTICQDMLKVSPSSSGKPSINSGE